MLKVAVVGNIASGKSAAEDYIFSKGYSVYDTDKIAHEILNNSADEVKEVFRGYDILEDNKISRNKLAEVVFTDKNEKQKLENIIYPKLKQEILRIFGNNSCKFVFVSVPLLFEAGWQNLFDKIIFIQADDDIRLNRLMKRNNLTREKALQRINSQKPQEEKVKQADFIICNNESIFNLQKQIDEIIILLETME